MWPLLGALGFGGWLGSTTNAAVTHPAAVQADTGPSITKIATYAAIGFAAFYAAKKVFK
jgi:hypothetical protein